MARHAQPKNVEDRFIYPVTIKVNKPMYDALQKAITEKYPGETISTIIRLLIQYYLVEEGLVDDGE